MINEFLANIIIIGIAWVSFFAFIVYGAIASGRVDRECGK